MKIRRTSAYVGEILAAVAVAAALASYVPLLRVAGRPLPVRYFLHSLFPFAAGHAGVLLLLHWRTRRKALWDMLYWAASFVALVAVGGASRAASLLLLVVVMLVIVRIGGALASLVLEEEFRGWGVSLGLGIVVTSTLSAALASVHLLRWWSVAAALMIALGLTMRPLPLTRLTARWSRLTAGWNVATALAVEGLVLVAAFVFVAGAAPETTSDGMRVYLPYARMLQRQSGFFDLPFHWSYVIPQAGLTYVTTLLVLAGPAAARWAMFLSWLALVGIVCRPGKEQNLEVRAALVLVTASCPVILSLSSTLMQDAYVWLVTALLALLAVQGKAPGSRQLAAGAGGLVGAAWVAKYSTLAFAAPLFAYYFIRTWKAAGWRRALQNAVIAGGCGVLVAGPWLWHIFSETGNPLFPFFSNIFPSSLWPNGVGRANLDTYRISGGWRGWLLSPIDMTYHTDRFAELNRGGLGLVFPGLLLLAVPVLIRGSAAARALAVCGILGTALIWLQTAYIRYWLPGPWLLALAAAEMSGKWSFTYRRRVWLSAVAVVVSLAQVPFAMLSFWFEPKGWPWEYYARKMTDEQYIARGYVGFSKLNRLQPLKDQWPRVWITNYEAAGHLNVQPVDALIWEIPLHGALDPRAQVKYLASAGCEYWIVDQSARDAVWFRATGLSRYYWRPENLVASEGAVAVYRMPMVGDVMRSFDERSAPGTDLVQDPGLETGDVEQLGFWRTEKTTRWIASSSGAFQGSGFVLLQPGGTLFQVIPLPSGLKEVETRVWARAAGAEKETRVALQIAWLGRDNNFLGAQSLDIVANDHWSRFQIRGSVPPEAVYAMLHLGGSEGPGTYVDEIHLYAGGDS